MKIYVNFESGNVNTYEEIMALGDKNYEEMKDLESEDFFLYLEEHYPDLADLDVDEIPEEQLKEITPKYFNYLKKRKDKIIKAAFDDYYCYEINEETNSIKELGEGKPF